MPRETLTIVKVPRKTDITDYSKKFDPCDQMYLELLENKTKIKEGLKDKDYHPHDEVDVKEMIEKKFEFPEPEEKRSPSSPATVVSSPPDTPRGSSHQESRREDPPRREDSFDKEKEINSTRREDQRGGLV